MLYKIFILYNINILYVFSFPLALTAWSDYN